MNKKRIRYVSRDRVESSLLILEEDLAQLQHVISKNGGRILSIVDAKDEISEPVQMPARSPSSATKVQSDQFNEKSDLYKLGYRITGLSRVERMNILTEKAIPQLGLKHVVDIIAAHVRNRKRQSDGMRRFHDAITEWEYDLKVLQKTHYKGDCNRQVH
ncbi:hypothetical protein, partial [Paenibacillus naphthalenovorans]|uniref:hypothetical protein n=1 Tax=Paenibacillus naphthalenovorans TaxID=162209 RepID=UPI003D2D7B2D